MEARGTGGAVEDLAVEVLGSKAEHLGVLLVGAPLGDYVVEFNESGRSGSPAEACED